MDGIPIALLNRTLRLIEVPRRETICLCFNQPCFTLLRFFFVSFKQFTSLNDIAPEISQSVGRELIEKKGDDVPSMEILDFSDVTRDHNAIETFCVYILPGLSSTSLIQVSVDLLQSFTLINRPLLPSSAQLKHLRNILLYS